VRNYTVLVALLSVACGGRAAIDADRAPGAAGAPGSALDWDQIIWDDDILAESVDYLWTGSAKDTWAVVADHVGSFQRAHWDGTSWLWRTVSEGVSSSVFDQGQIWGSADGQTLGGSSQQLQSWSGQAWANWGGTPGCRVVGGRAKDDVWCATETTLYRFDGARWTRQLMPGLRGILALAHDDVWVWGEAGASHFDGARWSLELTDLVKRMSASGPKDVWAVQDGVLLHSTGPGSAWTRQNPTGAQIASVWSESPTNTWIVGAGAAMRWNGATWELMSLPMQDERLLISGSAEDIWIAGTQMLVHGHPARK